MKGVVAFALKKKKAGSQVDLEFEVLLSQPPECWDYRYVIITNFTHTDTLCYYITYVIINIITM